MPTSFTNFKNRAQTLLSAAVTSTASIWTLVDADQMPSTTPFLVTCEDEIVKATSINVGSNQICVTRGQDDSTAAAHSRFDSVEQRIVKGMFTEIHGSVNSLESQISSFNVSSLGAQASSFFVSSINNLVGSTFCGSHVVTASSIHGVEGTILGTTDVQTVANKWIHGCQFDYTVKTVTISYTITSSDHILFVNPSTPITINLTESTAAVAGRPLQIKQVVTSFAVTIQPYTDQHIDAASDYTLTDINKYINLIDCGSGWNNFGSN